MIESGDRDFGEVTSSIYNVHLVNKNVSKIRTVILTKDQLITVRKKSSAVYIVTGQLSSFLFNFSPALQFPRTGQDVFVLSLPDCMSISASSLFFKRNPVHVCEQILLKNLKQNRKQSLYFTPCSIAKYLFLPDITLILPLCASYRIPTPGVIPFVL